MEYDVYREFIKAALKDPRMYKVNMPSSQYKYWDDYAKEHGGLGPNYVYPAPKDQVYDSRKHTTDKGKLPWHPTFSDESDYADMAISGHWTGNVYQMAPGMDTRDRLGELKMMIDTNNTDGDVYMLPNGKQLKR